MAVAIFDVMRLDKCRCKGGRFTLAFWASCCLFFLSFLSGAIAATTKFDFNYSSRQELLADGWDFLARTPAGQVRDTETRAGVFPPDISYDQVAHPGVLQIPVGGGDLWATGNDTVNSLFRNLSSNWISLQLSLQFAPVGNYQQVHLALYQDDDNYIEIGHGYNASVGGEGVLFVIEDGGELFGSPRIISRVGVVNSSVYLKLQRNLAYDSVTGFYSHDGTNWISLGEISHELVNPRLCIWAGGSAGGSGLTCDLRELEIVTSDTPLKPILWADPQEILFSGVAGESLTNSQQLRLIARRTQSTLDWTLTTNASWLSVSSNSGSTPAVTDVAVSTAGLSPGIYQSTLTCAGTNAEPAAVKVTLVVNPANRVRASTWRGGARGAMTVSVDDSRQSGFEKLIAAGLKGSYMLWGLSPYSPFASYHAAGMELGAHTVDHPCFAVSEPTRRYELEANIGGIVAGTGVPPKEIISFAWPCGFTTIKDQVIAADYFLSARGYNFNELEDPYPRNWMNLKNFNSHENDPQEFNPNAPSNPPDLKSMVDLAEAQGKWFNLVLHTMTNDDDAIPYSNSKDLWVAPLGPVVKYLQLRDRTIFTNYVEAATNLSLRLSRLPLFDSRLRSFETAVHADDLVTVQVNVSDIPSIGRLLVAGQPTPYRIRDMADQRLLLFDVRATTNLTTVELTLSNGTPVAVDQRINGAEDTELNLLLQGTGLAGNPLAYSVVAVPTNGTLTGVAPNLTYRGGTNFYGIDAFSFRVTDTVSSLTATGMVRIAISNLNDAPLVQNPFPTQQATYATPFLAYATNVFWDADEEPLTYSAIGLPPGIIINAAGTISGAPTQVGQFSVQLLGRDSRIPLLWVTNVFTFSVGKSNAPVNFTDLITVYDGLGHGATVTTVPAGLSVTVTYDGSANLPTNAGNYVVVGQVTEPNYSGAKTNGFTIMPASAVVNLDNLEQWFDGTPKIVTASTEPAGLFVHLTYDGTVVPPVTAGNYTVIGTVLESNYIGGATNTLSVAEVPLVITNVAFIDAASVAVTWQAVPNFTYQLQYKDQLDAGDWQAIIPAVTATEEFVTVTNSVVNQQQRFYRVQLMP